MKGRKEFRAKTLRCKEREEEDLRTTNGHEYTRMNNRSHEEENLPTTDGHECTRMNDKGGGESVFIGVHLWLRKADRVGMSLTQRR